MKVQIKNHKAITLIALIITIILLLILAGISISALTGTGIFERANKAKLETKMSEIEEFATMKIYELYTENVNNMDAVNDATITTALKSELQTKGYVIKDINTTEGTETVTGLKIQDSTGQNSFEYISLLQQKNTTIKVDLDKTSQSQSYVKIYDNWYEIIIKDKTVKVSREKSKEPVNSENKGNNYEIRLTPPTNGIIMTAGETQITSETIITPGALIKIQSGNDIGTFTFNVKETTSSIERNVDVKVTADPTYATDLSIAVGGGEEPKISPEETLQLVATKTPTTSTDILSWNIKSGSAVIDATGLVTADKDASVGSTITVSATCLRADGTTSTVGEKTLDITVIGGKVNEESKVGYYADINGDGNVDGVIYADLAVGGSGRWNNNSDSTYSFGSVSSGLKEYVISQETFSTDTFKTGKSVIKPKEGTSGIDRFYIMALSDIDSSSYIWYGNAEGNILDYASITKTEFGEGKNNTQNIIGKWNAGTDGGYGAQRSNDMWGKIQNEVKKGWFVPSRDEWSAFGDGLKITSTNYYKVGLRYKNWSSSLYNESYAWYTFLDWGWVRNNGDLLMTNAYVRLSRTF